MTLEPIRDAAHGAPEVIEPLCAVFRMALKREGLKYTPERAAILDAIIAIDDLFEADQLLDALKDRGHSVSKATVYRTLKLLEGAGIIRHVLFDREQSHYQLVMGTKGSTLLIHLENGEIETIETPELVALRDTICAQRGLTPEGHTLQIFVSGNPNPPRRPPAAGATPPTPNARM